MKQQPGMAIERGSGVGHYSFPSQSAGCSRRWSQPCGTSLTKSLAPLQGISDGRRIKDKTRTSLSPRLPQSRLAAIGNSPGTLLRS